MVCVPVHIAAGDSLVGDCLLPVPRPFHGGSLADNVSAWRGITRDPVILSYVRDCEIPFVECPVPTALPKCLIVKKGKCCGQGNSKLISKGCY